MRTVHVLVFTAIAALLLPVLAQAQPTVIPRTFGVGPYMVNLDDSDLFDKPSNGLPNVAPNTKVYMMISGKYSTDGKSWASSTWTLTDVPDGSAATISIIDDLRACFVPDMKGTYIVEVTGTDDASETGNATLTINVADYVGVGGFVEGTSATPPQCGVCHSSVKTDWLTTGHATAFKRKIDEDGGHFGKNCASCHITGSTDPAATGNGYLQLAASSSWEWPAANGPGNWDGLVAAEPAMAQLATISCENCHGPGSAHNGSMAENKMVTQKTSEACIQCHDAPTHHMKVREWANTGHAHGVGEPDNPWHMNRGSQTSEASDCARCHTSAGFIDVMDQVAEGKDYTEAFTSAPYDDPGGIGCVTCHDPHDTTHEFQLRTDTKTLCGSCHHIRTSSHGMHASTQGPMMEGVGGREFPGYTYTNSGHSYMEQGCATCHMTPAFDAQYATDLGGHTFKVTFDNGTPEDRSDDVLNATACESCHGGQSTMDFINTTQDEIKALLEVIKNNVPLKNGVPVSWTDTTLTQVQADAIWNYNFVAKDLSYGVHNTKYAKALLQSSIEALAVGVEEIGAAASFTLGQNFPNPFNPSTAIQFSIPMGTNVKIAIYDATGRLVNMLVNGYHNAGTYQVTWNGTTNLDSRFAPSGVYFYRLEAGSFVQSKKMVLMK